MRKKSRFVSLFLILVLVLVIIHISYSKFVSNGILTGSVVIPSKTIKITGYEYASSANADLDNSIINSFNEDILNSTIVLNNDSNSMISYEVTVKNYTNEASQYIETIFVNSDNPDIIVEINDVLPGDEIGVGETKTFVVTYKYKDELDDYPNRVINSEIKFVFGEYDPFPKVFSLEGSCKFNGATGENISGDECPDEFKNNKFIDTGVNLFNGDNYKKDFDIYLEYSGYVLNNQEANVGQQTFINSFQEGMSRNLGVVVRRSGTKTETKSRNSTAEKSVNINATTSGSIRLVRKDRIIYVSYNGGAFSELLDWSNFEAPFNLNTWIGAAMNNDGTAFRVIDCTISNAYIKLGVMEEDITTS